MKVINPINPVRREWMKEIRMQEMKLNNREIAELIGISYQHYNDIENGRRNPSIELSYKIAEFFDVPVERFFTDRTKFKIDEYRLNKKEAK